MRKLAIFALVLGLVIAFAVPAMAFRIEGPKDSKFYFGGTAIVDAGYFNLSKELTAIHGSSSDETIFFLNMARNSNVTANVQMGNTGFYWELRLGSSLAATHEQIDVASGTDKTSRYTYVENSKYYGYYTFGNCRLVVGKLDGFVGFFTPAQYVGLDVNNHVRGFGWGAFYDNRTVQLRFEQTINKQFSWHIALVDPFYSDFNVTAGGVTKNYDSHPEYPAVALKFAMNFGPVTLMPSGVWATTKWQDIPAGYDDSVQVWIAVLPVKATFGPFTATAQVSYGENVGTSGWLALQSGFSNAWRNPADGKFYANKSLAGFIDLGFKAGIANPHVYVGMDQVKNSDRWKVGDDSNTRTMYGASCPIAISPNFQVIPEFTYYDYGKAPGDPAKTKLGEEWMAGVQFMFAF